MTVGVTAPGAVVPAGADGGVGEPSSGESETRAAGHLRAPTLGIGIVTRNRVRHLQRTIEAIRRHTSSPYALVVADDGSTDGTVELLDDLGIARVLGSHRGVSWNRNRLLYALTNVLDCDVALLIDDDCRPVSAGWELKWIEAVRRYGHVNYAGGWLSHAFLGGVGSVAEPFRSSIITDQCVGFSREAVQRVGYLDTRLRGRGDGQVEQSSRLVRAGFGGEPGAAPDGSDVLWLIRGALEIEEERVLGGGAEVGRHQVEVKQVGVDQVGRGPGESENCHRLAWRTDAERATFLAEMDEAEATLGGVRIDGTGDGRAVRLAAGPGDPLVYFDEARPGRVRGWAVDRARPGVPMSLRFFVSGEKIWEGLADGLRRDLLAAGLGTDRAGFSMTFAGPGEGRVGILSALDADGRELPVTLNDGRMYSRVVLRDGRADASGGDGRVGAGGDGGRADAGGGDGRVGAGGDGGRVDPDVHDGRVDASRDDGRVDRGGGDGRVDAGVHDDRVDAGVDDGRVDADRNDGRLDAGGGDGRVDAGVHDGRLAAGVDDGRVDADRNDGRVHAGGGDGRVDAGVHDGRVAAGVDDDRAAGRDIDHGAGARVDDGRGDAGAVRADEPVTIEQRMRKAERELLEQALDHYRRDEARSPSADPPARTSKEAARVRSTPTGDGCAGTQSTPKRRTLLWKLGRR